MVKIQSGEKKMSNNNDIRESLLAIGDLLKQLIEEVVSLADCFYDDDEEDESKETTLTPEMVLEEASFEDKMMLCGSCERYTTCPNLHDANCWIMRRKIANIIGG